MSVSVVPLDPASPLGVVLAAQLTQVLGELQAAVWARQATGKTQPKPERPTPAKPPSRPVIPKTPPAGPRQPTRTAVHKQAPRPASSGLRNGAVHSGSMRPDPALAGTPLGQVPPA